ncbi:hypothetical protein RhiirA4_456293 [Rhizophagus irregularis]|uniref:Uncharacterized protein n=1 Tax=Rhizophagus irregularis TaxID=588596 RepID=A0A2I1G791_9GLOM|nr:hypothetical protein RhiirA4_456293 [Rhizophagus irregularis]
MKETADEEEEVVETTDNKKVKENKNGSFRLSEEHRQIVEQAFNGMKKERMWRLSTEKYVEKELFELGKKLEFEQSCCSFFHCDVNDVIIKQHFSKTELDEIDDASGLQIPELLDEIAEFLSKFDYKTKLNDIRDIIKETMFDGSYDHEKDHDKDYIVQNLYTQLLMYSNN